MNLDKQAKTNLLSLSYEEMAEFLANNLISVNIAEQIYKDLHKKHITKIDLLNISRKWKGCLSEIAFIPELKIIEKLTSQDKDTVKYLFSLYDGEFIESVLLFIKEKITLCISSQVGCGLGCEFCATGRMGFNRNLHSWEILQQVYTISNDIQRQINNIVYMGMGEPMLNYENVLTSAHILNNNMGMNIASQKISISTVGIAPMMRKFIHDEEPFHIILSLHSMIQEKREAIIPIAKRYKIDELIDLIRLYYKERRDWVTVAYIMIKNVNMYSEDIVKLKSVLRELKVKLNFIPYNSIEGLKYVSPSPDEVKKFYEEFLNLNLPVNIRKTQGNDIKGACGQLIIESTPPNL